MNRSDYWNAWLDANCPKFPASLKSKYSQALSENDVTDEYVLKEWLDLDDNYLASIGINNKLIVKSIKVPMFLDKIFFVTCCLICNYRLCSE